MNVRITEDIRTATELKNHMKEVFEHAHRTGRPVVVTVNGKPDIVLLDAAVFEKKLMALNLANLLAEGEADVRSGDVRSARTFLKQLRHGKKISR